MRPTLLQILNLNFKEVFLNIFYPQISIPNFPQAIPIQLILQDFMSTSSASSRDYPDKLSTDDGGNIFYKCVFDFGIGLIEADAWHQYSLPTRLFLPKSLQQQKPLAEGEHPSPKNFHLLNDSGEVEIFDLSHYT